MASSEEYLASLGFDTKDADASIQKTITLLGHLGNQFPTVEKAAGKAEAALVKIGGTGDGVAKKLGATSSAANTLSDSSLPKLRYALYDVATTYSVISGATLAFGGAALKAGADFESAFTNVERTSSAPAGALKGLKEDLVDLSTQIPLAFGEVAQIATLGNQLGVADTAIVQFTQDTAKFATVTGMTAEASANAFGSLGQLLHIGADDYNRLGSAIALVGRKSVATEPEIVAMTQRLAASATKAGFTTQEVVALSGALASLRVAPERAQGVMEVYFNRLNTALAQGGEKLDAFAYYAQMSTDEVRELVATDPNKFFGELASGLASLDSVGQTNALAQLGLDGIRAGEVFGRFSGNLAVFNQALADSNQGFAEGTELNRQYALTLDDLNTQLTLLWNALTALAATGSEELVPGLAGAVAALVELVNGARAFIQTDFGGSVAQIVIALGIAVGLFFAYQAAVALATASTFALMTAQEGLAASNRKVGIIGFIRELGTLVGLQGRAAAGNVAVGATAEVAATRLQRAGQGAMFLWRGLLAIGRATIVIALLQGLMELLFNTNEAIHFVADSVQGMVNAFATGFSIAGRAVSQFLGPVGALLQALGALLKVDIGQITDGWRDFADTNFPKEEVEGYTVSADIAADTTDDLSSSFDGLGSSADDAGGAVEDAAEEVRTLIDYANDLSQVFDRTFQLQFGNQQGQDAVDSTINDMVKEQEDAKQAIVDAYAEMAEAVKKYKVEMAGLTADKKIKEYWLKVAKEYGDSLRQGELQADIAEITGKQADASKKLGDAEKKKNETVAAAYDVLNPKLTGNTQAAIDNRAAILALVQQMDAELAQMAANGASQDELKAKAEEYKKKLIQLGIQLGYSTDDLKIYTDHFDYLKTAIDKVPKNITIKTNINPALQALAELEAKTKAVVNKNYGSINVPVYSSFDEGGVRKSGRASAIEAAIERWKITLKNAIASGADNQAQRAIDNINSLSNQLASGQYKKGGWTGGGNPNTEAGVVHKREFVLNATGAQMLPMSVLNAMNQGRAPLMPVATAGKGNGVNGRTVVAELSAYDRGLLMAIRDSVGLEISGPALSATAAAGFENDDRRRSG